MIAPIGTIIGIIGLTAIMWLISKNWAWAALFGSALLTGHFTNSLLCVIGSLFGFYGIYMAFHTFMLRRVDKREKTLLGISVSLLFLFVSAGLFTIGLEL